VPTLASSFGGHTDQGTATLRPATGSVRDGQHRIVRDDLGVGATSVLGPSCPVGGDGECSFPQAGAPPRHSAEVGPAPYFDEGPNLGAYTHPAGPPPPASSVAFSGSSAISPNVSIEPPYLVWSDQPLCSPSAASIIVTSIEPHKELLILSLSTDNIQFYPSNFRQTALAPGESTRIFIVYLPRTLGTTDGTMIVQTSAGGFLVHMRGFGAMSPYHITPLLGAKVPAGAAYSYGLRLHNPYGVTLNVVEVYTNEDFLWLSLPDSEDASLEPKAVLWEIPPHESTSIVNVAFFSPNPGKFRGLVHVKTEAGTLIMPVDVHAIKGGIYRYPEELGFDTLTKTNEKSARRLSLVNSGTLPILVEEVYMPVADTAITIDFQAPVLLLPNINTEVATITYNAKGGQDQQRVSGKVMLRTNDTNPLNGRLEVPYAGRLLLGEIQYNFLNATFACSSVGTDPTSARYPDGKTLRLSHTFPQPVMFYSARASDSAFEILDFPSGLTVAPDEEGPVFRIKYKPVVREESCPHKAFIILDSNVTEHFVPLHVYPGTLSVAPCDESDEAHSFNDLRFGTLSVGETRKRVFNVTNMNPVPVVIESIVSSLPSITISLQSLSLQSGLMGQAVDDETDSHELSLLEAWSGGALTLDPGATAVFAAAVVSTIEERRNGTIEISTLQERLSFATQYETLEGSLTVTPSIVRFESAFPGHVVTKTLYAKSTYPRPLTLTGIQSSDSRFITVLHITHLEPNEKTKIGYMRFDPAQCEPSDNYMTWNHVRAEPGIHKLDLKAYADIMAERNSIWMKLEEEGGTEIRASLNVRTDVLQSHTVALIANLTRPSITKDPLQDVDFSLTQVGTQVQKPVRVYNPSDDPIYVEILPCANVSVVGHAGTQTRLSSALVGKLGDLLSVDLSRQTSKEERVFALASDARYNSVVPALSEAVLGPVEFHPSSLTEESTGCVLLKSNLTLFQPVLLRGKGGSGRLVFNSADSDGTLPIDALHFEIDSFQLGFSQIAETGQYERNGSFPHPFSFQRSFLVSNEGSLPMLVRSLSVERRGCKAFRFRVDTCWGFSLEPGQSSLVTISYIPDFASSKAHRTLVLSTSIGEVSLPMVAVLPHELLPACQAALPVADVERSVRRACSIGMIFLAIWFAFSVLQEVAAIGVVENKLAAQTKARAPPVRSEKARLPTQQGHLPIPHQDEKAGLSAKSPKQRDHIKPKIREAPPGLRGEDSQPSPTAIVGNGNLDSLSTPSDPDLSHEGQSLSDRKTKRKGRREFGVAGDLKSKTSSSSSSSVSPPTSPGGHLSVAPSTEEEGVLEDEFESHGLPREAQPSRVPAADTSVGNTATESKRASAAQRLSPIEVPKDSVGAVGTVRSSSVVKGASLQGKYGGMNFGRSLANAPHAGHRIHARGDTRGTTGQASKRSQTSTGQKANGTGQNRSGISRQPASTTANGRTPPARPEAIDNLAAVARPNFGRGSRGDLTGPPAMPTTASQDPTRGPSINRRELGRMPPFIDAFGPLSSNGGMDRFGSHSGVISSGLAGDLDRREPPQRGLGAHSGRPGASVGPISSGGSVPPSIYNIWGIQEQRPPPEQRATFFGNFLPQNPPLPAQPQPFPQGSYGVRGPRPGEWGLQSPTSRFRERDAGGSRGDGAGLRGGLGASPGFQSGTGVSQGMDGSGFSSGEPRGGTNAFGFSLFNPPGIDANSGEDGASRAMRMSLAAPEWPKETTSQARRSKAGSSWEYQPSNARKDDQQER